MTTTAPYGSWDSPITAEMLTSSAIRLSQVEHVQGVTYWIESRPLEGGRSVIVSRKADGATRDVTPPEMDSRSRANEYGGGAYGVSGGAVVSCNFVDQRVYRLDGKEPVAITPEPKIPAGDRYADFAFHGDLIIAVRERHHKNREPTNTLVVFPTDGSAAPKVIASGHDFFSSPRVSPDGNRLAWLAWDHPNMPWDGTGLWVGALDGDGSVSEPERVAGGIDESIFQPEWSPDGELHFVSDRTGWWNLYRIRDGEDGDIYPAEAEFGFPQWVFAMRSYRFDADGRIVCVYTRGGHEGLATLDHGTLTTVEFDRDTIGSSLAIGRKEVFLIAGSHADPMGLVRVDLVTSKSETILSSQSIDVDHGFLSKPETIEFPTRDGATAHAFYYPPTNPHFVGPDDELPPLLVVSHGGPTSATTAELSLANQFWTSRGFALVDVNYRGSTGYGRAYREALNGNWGVVDTDDCIAAARYLAAGGHVDGERMAIRGGSAGGYTTLCALTFHDVFAAGASYFGVGDLIALAEMTHKFESRYLDSMVGPYPETEDLYRLRSPLNHTDELSCPVILFQGLDDKVVPPSQAEDMVAALDAKGLPYAFVAFEGEGHGFRRAQNIEAAAEAELSFYGQVFDFTPAGDIPPVRIHNEDAL
jgi:dipeptidyl aminopeptidase/acylaminoacyl peptidase